MLAEPRICGPAAPDATLSPPRGSRGRARSEVSAETAEYPPAKRLRRWSCSRSPSAENQGPISNSDPYESTSNTAIAGIPSHSHPGEALYPTCVNQERPDPSLQSAPVAEDPDLFESCSIEDCRPHNGEACCNLQCNDLQLPNPVDGLELSDSPTADGLQPTSEPQKPCLDLQVDRLAPTGLDRKEKASGWSFYNFPPEIRNLIYKYSMNWPTSYELYAPYNRQIDDYYANRSNAEEEFPEFSGVLRTPTILLLCRSITAECLPILQAKTFIVDRLPPWLPGDERPMLLSDFVGIRTIQSLRNIELRITAGQGRFGSGWVWAWIVLDIIGILRQRNSFNSLTIIVSIFDDGSASIWNHEPENLRSITAATNALRVKNPRFWAPGKIEYQYWIIKDKVSTHSSPPVVKEKVATRHYLEETTMRLIPGKETRAYPDPEFWPGNVLEFI